MESIRLTIDNIEELSKKLNDLGYKDFEPLLPGNKTSLPPGLFYWGTGEPASRLYSVDHDWEFQIGDDGSLTAIYF